MERSTHCFPACLRLLEASIEAQVIYANNVQGAKIRVLTGSSAFQLHHPLTYTTVMVRKCYQDPAAHECTLNATPGPLSVAFIPLSGSLLLSL